MYSRPTTQDVSWFLDLKDKDGLDLNPSYQRRSVWSLNDKRFFIDTVLNNYPAPPVFLHEKRDIRGKTTYHVVDGKQRLQTVLEFAEDKVRIPDDFVNSSLQGKYFKDLENDDKLKFWNYVVRVEMVPDVKDAVIRNIFERINRNSRKLTHQELRHAKYEGWLTTLVEEEAGTEEWREFGLVTTARSKRMADAQFISELCAIILRNEISGLNQSDLDQLYAEYDELSYDSEVIASDVKEEILRLKRIIFDLLRLRPRIGNYLKILGHFYTLWAYLYLTAKGVLEAEVFAPRYLAFMEAVNSVPKSKLDATQSTAYEDHELNYDAVIKYAQSFWRAKDTDAQPRKERLEALKAAIQG